LIEIEQWDVSDDLWALFPLSSVSRPGARLDEGASISAPLDQADRLWKRLGGTGCAFDCDELPPKPPHMHWSTYRRLEAQYEELQNRWVVGAIARLDIAP
jgi:hypothetical protein